jgi:hypothetical protein
MSAALQRMTALFCAPNRGVGGQIFDRATDVHEVGSANLHRSAYQRG